MMSLDTDAHRLEHLDNMQLAVGTARRGWLEKGDVLNTRPLDEVRRLLRPVEEHLNYMSVHLLIERGRMNMGLIEIADSIKTMEIRGAGLIARSAAEALKQQALEYQGSDLAGAEEATRRGAGEQLIASRPTAISLWNAVQATVRRLLVGDQRGGAALAGRSPTPTLFIDRSSKAVETIGRIGSKRLKDGMTVLTHCNSKAALAVIKSRPRRGQGHQGLRHRVPALEAGLADGEGPLARRGCRRP